jgi:hypothetical protein
MQRLVLLSLDNHSRPEYGHMGLCSSDNSLYKLSITPGSILTNSYMECSYLTMQKRALIGQD